MVELLNNDSSSFTGVIFTLEREPPFEHVEVRIEREKARIKHLNVIKNLSKYRREVIDMKRDLSSYDIFANTYIKMNNSK